MKVTVMRSFLDKLYEWSCWLGAGCIALICLLVVCQVVLNLIDRLSSVVSGSAIGLTIPSYADFTGFLLAAASFLSLAYTLRQGAHIRVVLLTSRLPRRFLGPIEGWCVSCGLALSLYFTWYTVKLTHESFIYNDLSAGMIAVPIWIPQLFMLSGLVILSIALIDELVAIIRGYPPSYSQRVKDLSPKGDRDSSQSKEEAGDHV